ncbi:MAG: Holliday junction branch migration protein RuvA [Firmicutes bacterium]|nr:Holliday junction branch migration protein RuvA [Bacillota bacterium]
MIGYIKGFLHPETDGTVIIENASGIGFKIFVPTGSALYKMPEGTEVKVFTSMQVKEDDISLYGFMEREEQELFELLITVNGIGAKGAMSIMSSISVSELKLAIAAGDAKTICKANGVGKKTAERLILELKDKMGAFTDSGDGAAIFVDDEALGDDRTEAVSALIALGYTKNEAAAAVGKIKGDGLTVEDYIKQALKKL